MASKKTENKTTGLVKMDDGNQALAFGGQKEVSEGHKYINYYSSKSNSAGEMEDASPGASITDMFLFDDGDVIHLPGTTKYTIVKGTGYWADIDDGDGEHENVTFEDPGWKDDRFEGYLGVVIVDTGEDFHATVSTIRAARCNAFQKHAAAVMNVAKDGGALWVNKAPNDAEKKVRAALKAHLAAPYCTWMQVKNTVCKSKKSKRDYCKSKNRSATTDMLQAKRFSEWYQAGGEEEINDAIAAYDARYNWLEERM